MKYLLDTCTVSDFVKGQAGVLARIKATPPSLISVSVITRMEIESGLQLNPDRARKLAPILNDFLAAVTTLAFSEADNENEQKERADDFDLHASDFDLHADA